MHNQGARAHGGGGRCMERECSTPADKVCCVGSSKRTHRAMSCVDQGTSGGMEAVSGVLIEALCECFNQGETFMKLVVRPWLAPLHPSLLHPHRKIK